MKFTQHKPPASLLSPVRCTRPVGGAFIALALATLMGLATTATTRGAPTPGDIAIIGFNADDPEDFAFVTLVDLSNTVDLVISESGNDTITYRTPASGLAQGTVVVVTPPDGATPPMASIGTVVGYSTSNWGWGSGGDALLISQGGQAIHLAETLESYTIPTGLSTAAFTAVSHPTGIDNGRYIGARTGTRGALLQAIADTNQWQYTDGIANEAQVLNAAPYTNRFDVQPPPQSAGWQAVPIEGLMYLSPEFLQPSLKGATNLSSGTPPRVLTIQSDNNDALIATNCFASPRDSIGKPGYSSFAFYFPTNAFPNGASITSAVLRAQYQGPVGKTGALRLHASDNRAITQWYTGGSNAGARSTGDLPWSNTETQTLWDVSSLLVSEAAINQSEFVVTNRSNSQDRVYFDYFSLEVGFALSGAPTVTTGNGASPVSAATATLNGVLETGQPNTRILIHWGRTNGETNASGWEHVADIGPRSPGPFSTTLTDLPANQTFYYRPFATNDIGTHWAANSQPFATTPPALTFTTANASGLESVTPVTATISLAVTSATPVSVNAVISGGSATPGEDYVFTPLTITLPPGALTTNLTIGIVDDVLDEESETFVLALTHPTNAVIPTPQTFTYTILDNDAATEVGFIGAPYTAAEGTGTLQIRVALNAASARAISLNYFSSNGTATAGSDYTATSGLLSWEVGETKTNVILLAIADETVPELAEDFFVYLGSPVNTRIAAPNPARVTIPENDFIPPIITNRPPQNVTSNTATLRAELLSEGGQPTRVWFYWGLTDGGTSPGGWPPAIDKGLVGTGIVEHALASLTTNTVYVYRAVASNALGRVWASPAMTFVTGPPTVEFAASQSSGPESTSPVRLSILLRDPAPYSRDVTIQYALTGGSASTPQDVTLLGTSVTISAGMTQTNIALLVVNDTLSENDEDVVITLSAATNGQLGTNRTHRYTIIDNDVLPVASIRGQPITAAEGGASLVVTVRLDRVAGRTVGTTFETESGTALDGTLFRGTNRWLSWPAGTTLQTVSIPLLDDGTNQPDTFFFMRLHSPSNALIETASTTVTVTEKTTAPPQVSNGSGAGRIRGGLARLTGSVTAGRPYPVVTIYWGPTNGVTSPGAWQRSLPLGVQSGDFSAEITGLTPGTTYHYRCFATNTSGFAWASATTSFTTPASRNFYINDGSLTGDIYTTATGNDDADGTSPATPKATLQNLLATLALSAGDTVFIDTGLYASDATTLIDGSHQGSSNAPIVFRGSTSPAGTVMTLTEGAMNFNDVVWGDISGDTFLTFEHLRFTGGSSGLRLTGNALNKARGIEVRSCTFNNNFFFNGGLTLQNCVAPRIESNLASGNQLAGIEIFNCDAPVVMGNTCSGNGYYGIWTTDCHSAHIEANTCSGHTAGGGRGIGLGGFSFQPRVVANTAFGNLDAGIWIFNAQEAMIEGNTAFDNTGNGFSLNGTSYTIANNTAHDNGQHGFHVPANAAIAVSNNLAYGSAGFNAYFPAAKNQIRIENNTLYGGNGLYINDPLDVTIKNTIIWAIGAGKVALVIPNPPGPGEALLSNYNDLLGTAGATIGLWAASVASNLPAWRALSAQDTNSLAIDPLFVDPIGAKLFQLQSLQGSFRSYAGIDYWHPDAAMSPMIDAGDPASPVGAEPEPNGFRRNIGAYGGTPKASKSAFAGALFTLTLTAIPEGAGALYVSPLAGLYPSGTVVTVWAVVTNADFAWDRWSGDLTTTQASNTWALAGNMTIQGLFTLLQTNSYGIPNWWFDQFDLAANDTGAEADTDKDGHANWEEFIAGTHPTNPASVLKVTAIRNLPPRRELVIASVTNRLYRLERTTNLVQNVWTLVPIGQSLTSPLATNPLPGTGTVTTFYFIPPPPQGALRVGVE